MPHCDCMHPSQSLWDQGEVFQKMHGTQNRLSIPSMHNEGRLQGKSPPLMLGALAPHSSRESRSVNPWLTTSWPLKIRSVSYIYGARGLQVSKCLCPGIKQWFSCPGLLWLYVTGSTTHNPGCRIPFLTPSIPLMGIYQDAGACSVRKRHTSVYSVAIAKLFLFSINKTCWILLMSQLHTSSHWCKSENI